MKKTTIAQLPSIRNKTALTVRERKRFPNRPLTEAQIRLLLAALDNIRDDALIRLGLSVVDSTLKLTQVSARKLTHPRG
jgi:hypothetical protein